MRNTRGERDFTDFPEILERPLGRGADIDQVERARSREPWTHRPPAGQRHRILDFPEVDVLKRPARLDTSRST